MQLNSQIYKSPLWLRYAVPLGAFIIVVALRLTLLREATGQYPLSLFLIPVILGAWYGGVMPATFIVILAVFAGTTLFSPYNLKLETISAWERIFTFACVNTVCVFIVTRLHLARYKAEQEIARREKIEEELRKEIASRNRAEEQLAAALQKAEIANKAKTDFLANISHEIRTPLNAVVGLTKILAMSSPFTAKQKEFVSTLQLSADSLLTLITDVLDISKIEAGAIEIEAVPFNLCHICEDVVSIMAQKAKEKNLHLFLETDSEIHADYIGDPQRIKQIVLNLCGNAIKFTDSGFVSIKLHANALDVNADMASILVRDTGIGIPPDQLPKIFDQFAQGDSAINKKYGGTGLGLTISKKLIEAMGGDISVESKHAIGSVFRVRIPLNKASKTAIQPAQTKISGYLELSQSDIREKILIVEDNEANILVIKSYMERLGYGYDIARTGADALKKIQEGSYLAVLMDIRMPGLDGLETTRIIRKNELRLNQSRLYIIGLTANALENERQRCLEAGMDDFMSKPYDPAVLEEKLKSLSLQDDLSASSGSNLIAGKSY